MSATPVLEVLIIGAGFGGLGMGIRLRQEGVDDFLILERGSDIGGVWRDNTYPGAACDVPSVLYSFSFAPNPNWSCVYPPQAEIHAYLHDCAAKFDLNARVRTGVAVADATWEELPGCWRVTLDDGTVYRSRLLISAVGQLSQPVIPRLAGAADFKGLSFHSAAWPAGLSLADKRVAVIGCGASAVQFVPAIAPETARLTVFQRSANYLLPRHQRAYTQLEKWLHAHLPPYRALVRLKTFLSHEVLALGFGRLNSWFSAAASKPFRALLKRQVPAAATRAALTPDYPVGCKRVLISSDYLKTFALPNVALSTTPIRRVLPDGIETDDGAVHLADVLIYGTGFNAIDFLAGLEIRGTGGQRLHDLWREGAAAHLGLSVPGFPNFFLLYGPNTNLGHNSILFMLESQFDHVLRCRRKLLRAGAVAMEVDAGIYERGRRATQQALRGKVWSQCRNWYTDARGHNPTNWPGFTLSYRWQVKYGNLNAYRLLHTVPGLEAATPDAFTATLSAVALDPPPGLRERLTAAVQRTALRFLFRGYMGPPRDALAQRRMLARLSRHPHPARGVTASDVMLGGVPCEHLLPERMARLPDGSPAGALLYLHGGGFCIGNPLSHRPLTSRLARATALPAWVPDYRLAPEHPFPAAIDDVVASYRALRRLYPAERIVVGGDSAGGALAMALALQLREDGEALPAALLLLSPVTDPTWQSESIKTRAAVDPMLHHAWLEQAVGWYNAPATAMLHRPLELDLRGLPPLMIQVGDQEMLRDDSIRLAAHAARCGVPCRLELYRERWHVFQLPPNALRSSMQALDALARFTREAVGL